MKEFPADEIEFAPNKRKDFLGDDNLDDENGMPYAEWELPITIKERKVILLVIGHHAPTEENIRRTQLHFEKEFTDEQLNAILESIDINGYGLASEMEQIDAIDENGIGQPQK